MKPIETVGELIEILKNFDSSSKIRGTWEGQINDLYAYKAEDGTILLDSDNCSYRVPFQGLKCAVCGQPARMEFKETGPVCYTHWPKDTELTLIK